MVCWGVGALRLDMKGFYCKSVIPDVAKKYEVTVDRSGGAFIKLTAGAEHAAWQLACTILGWV